MGCGDGVSLRGPDTATGVVTRYGRLGSAGIRVRAEALGRETYTDASGRYTLAGLSADGTVLTFDTPGFAPEQRRFWTNGEQVPLALYRGKRIELPANFEVAAAAEVPPAGLLLTADSGERVLVDLAAGAVGLHLGADWQPLGPGTMGGDGYVVDADPLAPGGGTTSPSADLSGFTVRGAWRDGGEAQGTLLARPFAADGSASADGLLAVSAWLPGRAPIPFPSPVLQVGPGLILGSAATQDGPTQAVTLLVETGWVSWIPGHPAQALADVPSDVMPSVVPLFAPDGAARALCWRWTADKVGVVDCVLPGEGVRTVVRLDTASVTDATEVEVGLAASDPALVVWRTPADGLCRAVLDSGAAGTAAFPCDTVSLEAHGHAGEVIFRDGAGMLHRLSAAGGETLMGRGSQLATGPGGRLGFLADGQWLTLVRADGERLSAAEPCSPSTAVHALSDGLLAVDPERRRALHLGDTGVLDVLPLLDADVRAAQAPATISQAGEKIALSGPNGFARIDLDTLHTVSLVHRGWTFLAFGWPGGDVSTTALPELGLLRTRGRLRAVDLYTLHTEVLGEGPRAGLMHGRVWSVNDRGLYVVDDPAAE